jgi:hypothetical protein
VFKRLFFIGHREPMTADDAALLRELQSLPYWPPLLKVLQNCMEDIRDQIVEGKDTKQSLEALSTLRGTLESFGKERAAIERSSLL